MVDAILDIILSVLASIFGTAIDDWFRHQSWWVKTIVVATFVFFVIMILYFLAVLPLLRSSRG